MGKLSESFPEKRVDETPPQIRSKSILARRKLKHSANGMLVYRIVLEFPLRHMDPGSSSAMEIFTSISRSDVMQCRLKFSRAIDFTFEFSSPHVALYSIFDRLIAEARVNHDVGPFYTINKLLILGRFEPSPTITFSKPSASPLGF